MKGNKCPYCGRRISYMTTFHEKNHGVYECTRCKKESKIKIDKKLIITFIVLVLIIILYIVFWRSSGLYNNILGIIPPVILLTAFYFSTPLFIKYIPLKRFLDDIKKSEESGSSVTDTISADEYIFNRKVFDEIKNKRNTPASSIEKKIERIVEQEEKYIPVIEDVSEAHTSSHSTLKRVSSNHSAEQTVYEEDVRQYIPKKEKPDGTRYTANRKF